MPYALSACQMRRIERSAMDSGRVTGLELMSLAGQGAAACILRFAASMRGGLNRATILCGPGNNGGDGYVVAGSLKRSGMDVGVYEMPSRGRSGDASEMRRIWLESGPTERLEKFSGAPSGEKSILVDALFGTGLARPVGGDVVEALNSSNRFDAFAALDMLSGVDSDTGEFLASGASPGMKPDLVIAFEAPKIGHYLGEGGWRRGRLDVVPIGLDEELAGLAASEPVAKALERSEIPISRAFGKSGGKHKYEYGHLLVVAGGAGRGGAARLAARSALRTGAGLVTVGACRDALAEHASQLNAEMLARIGSAAELRRVLRDKRINALCLGPALGKGGVARKMALEALAHRRPVVLDADALAIFAGDVETLAKAVDGPVVLTPHEGEFANLFPDLSIENRKLAGLSKLDAVRRSAARSGSTVLLKGASTVISDPDGRAFILASVGDSAKPWLATAGAGDSLCGVIAALLARGASAVEAAAYGAWLHAEAGRVAGPGMIAEDIPEAVAEVFREMNL
ncbi:MAG: NAD(P)H-hydrate dehydratase [Albidovulum sp.]|nr:NAD(P)H-hydrate dehydratase [Albidovulum sp.]